MPGTTITTTMEMNPNISDILREVIMFLECLRDTQLPLALQSLREKLLEHSKNTLSAIKRSSSSAEPYLDMNSGPKTILLTKNEDEEYVGMENSPQKQNYQDYYETFEHENESKMIPIEAENVDRARSEQDNGESNQTLINIYKNLSAAQSKSKCHKCGPLHRKEGKKFFMSENRACWIALVGSHMLMYRSERQTRPAAIYPIRGYMARPAPNLQSTRDRYKGDLTFEIYCPGNETLQFIARTPKDMHQWVAKVCEVGCGQKGTNDHGNISNRSSKTSMSEDNATSPRRRKSSKSSDKKKSPNKGEMKSNKIEARKVESPPPLPTRIPRRLPSLPTDDTVPSYKAVEDYDDNDDIYYKIEDLNSKMTYQNVTLAKRQVVNVGEHEEAGEYDDVRASKNKKEGQVQEKKFDAALTEEELYDDIFALSSIKATAKDETAREVDPPVAADNGEESLYDDIGNLSRKSTKDRVRDQTEPSSKFLQKKSFLERVWSRRELPAKTDKRVRGKKSSSPIPSSSATEAMPTYDDVSDLMSHPVDSQENDLPEYNCPPPPRPIYTKPPSIMNQIDLNSTEEFYDDVNTYREQYNENDQSTQESCAIARETNNEAMEMRTNGELIEIETEHYLSPRSDIRVHEAPDYQSEELYDDIALSVKFRAQQRDINEKKDSEDSKKLWNRFAVNRNRRSGEPACLTETNRRNTNDGEEIDDLTEATIKRNTFQKLISKMENSLAKVSVRGQTSFPMNKPSTASNNL